MDLSAPKDLSELISWAAQYNASDIHLAPESPIWLRCRGHLQAFPEYSFLAPMLISQLLTLLNSHQHDQMAATQSVDAATQFANGVRLRINLFQQLSGLSAALRIVPNTIPALNALPAPKVFYDLIQERHGLILVTGPTGSGKSTTLAALVAEINQQMAKHIITLEDPVEFIHSSQKSLITQRECYTHFANYPGALRSALREDPDVILIGELRDAETMQLALTAAETGHLVLGTLHTATAASSIHRFIDVFPGVMQSGVRSLLADCLVAVISQRLVNGNMQECRAEYEILRATPAVRQLIRDQNISQLITAMQTGAQYGMQTFRSRDDNAQGGKP